MQRIEVEMPKARTDFGKRWLEMMQAQTDGLLLAHQVRTITLNAAAHQRDTGILRRDRYVPLKNESMSPEYFGSRENALVMNMSDAAILDEMEEVEREAGLDMSETEQWWFDYIVGEAADV
jgi:hypothetical protein